MFIQCVLCTIPKCIMMFIECVLCTIPRCIIMFIQCVLCTIPKCIIMFIQCVLCTIPKCIMMFIEYVLCTIPRCIMMSIQCVLFVHSFSTVLMLVKMVVEYCQCVTDIPTAAPDLLTRLVDLLKVGCACCILHSHSTALSQQAACTVIGTSVDEAVTQSRSERMKGSKERYLLGQDKTSKCSG